MKFAIPSFPQTRMLSSIPECSWRLNASDPQAFTRLLALSGLVVTGLEYNDVQDTLHLVCELSANNATCPTCQQESGSVHQYTKRIVRDLPWAGKPCYIEFFARRFYCPGCACPFREELDWLPRCSRLTQRYRHAIFVACRQTNLRAVSQRERLCYKSVERLYYALAQAQTPVLPQTPVRHLGIDEFAMKKGHDQFAVVLSDLEAGRVIAVLPDRKKETLLAYFATWSASARQAVEQVALDLWETYQQVAEACFPQARPVADRFHVMKNLTERVTTARRHIQRALPEAARHTLKGCRWLLVRNQADLSEADQARLEAMFALAPELAGLHRLKEAFRNIFETASDPTQAAALLEAWITQVEQSGLSALTSFVALLRKRWEHILNYFHTRLTSGGVEGLNNKIKVVKRCAYGFRNFEHLAFRVLVECDGTT